MNYTGKIPINNSSQITGIGSEITNKDIERVFEAEIMSDEKYTVRSVQSSDQAHLAAIGFGALDVLDGVEIVGMTPTSPTGYATTSSGEFPVMIVYGMAGTAIIGGIGFFIFSNRRTLLLNILKINT